MAQTPIYESIGAIGSIQNSVLTEVQFQTLYGTGWILADGRSIAGSSLASVTSTTTAPDLRGMVLRGKNNSRSDGNQNPDGDLALGTFQADAFQGHLHSGVWLKGGNYGGGASGAWETFGSTSDPVADGSGHGTPRTASETRMKNVTVNYFIRIN